MNWFKRNLFVILAVVIAFGAIGALALESAGNTGLPPADTGKIGQDDAAKGTEYQNRGEAAAELVKSWPEYGEFSEYELALVLDPDGKQMHGTMQFTYLNAEEQPMGELRFLLYANSHEKQHYGIFEADDMDRAYPNGFSPGSIEIKSVACADGKTEHMITGEQKHVLQVKLPRQVEPGQTTRLTMEYTVTIPNSLGRFGYGDNTMSLVNCNPILAVYDNDTWYDYPYYSMGDPFYSETADYKATITAPAGWTIAATGVLARKPAGDDDVWTVDAPGRRDFGFVASDSFEVMQADAGGVLVRSYYLPGHKSGGRAALDCGVQSINLFSETYGPYPFAEFSVVEADFFIGGMEYPGMVLIDQSLYPAGFSRNRILLDLVVAHETAHQWWYSVVGGNEVTEPWLDEGLTEFSTQFFFERERDTAYNDYYKSMNDYYQMMRTDQSGGYAVTLPTFGFNDSYTYSAWVYDRAAQILQELRGDIGDETFFAALRDYYEGSRLGVATRDDLEEAFERASGRELTQWFEQRFNATGE